MAALDVITLPLLAIVCLCIYIHEAMRVGADRAVTIILQAW